VAVRPAIVSVPRRAAPLLYATVYVTTPLPVPLAPVSILIHASLLVAVHAQVLVWYFRRRQGRKHDGRRSFLS
jgi:hypothetical protein